jgi:hypothetical protein
MRTETTHGGKLVSGAVLRSSHLHAADQMAVCGRPYARHCRVSNMARRPDPDRRAQTRAGRGTLTGGCYRYPPRVRHSCAKVARIRGSGSEPTYSPLTYTSNCGFEEFGDRYC